MKQAIEEIDRRIENYEYNYSCLNESHDESEFDLLESIINELQDLKEYIAQLN